MLNQSPGTAHFCSVGSLEVDEPLHASATRVDVWLVLEVTDAWGRKAFAESDLPGAVKAHLGAAEEAIPHARIQFIKRHPPHMAGSRQFYVANASLAEPALYHFSLEAYEDLLALDLAAIAAGDPAHAAHRTEQPLFAVCTNGRRDACCAKFGLATFDRLVQLQPDAGWRTTHLGGHRFAPTMIILPEGLHYGRVVPGELPTILENHARSQITPDRYRGRTIYDAPVQAAEHFIRVATGDLAIDAYRLQHAAQQDDATWSVTFTDRSGVTSHIVTVSQQQAAQPLLKSCADAEAAFVSHFELVDHTITRA